MVPAFAAVLMFAAEKWAWLGRMLLKFKFVHKFWSTHLVENIVTYIELGVYVILYAVYNILE